MRLSRWGAILDSSGSSATDSDKAQGEGCYSLSFHMKLNSPQDVHSRWPLGIAADHSPCSWGISAQIYLPCAACNFPELCKAIFASSIPLYDMLWATRALTEYPGGTCELTSGPSIHLWSPSASPDYSPVSMVPVWLSSPEPLD